MLKTHDELVRRRDALVHSLMMEIAENYIDEAFSIYGGQKTLVAEHLGISVEELEFLSDYLGIDCGVWED